MLTRNVNLHFLPSSQFHNFIRVEHCLKTSNVPRDLSSLRTDIDFQNIVKEVEVRTGLEEGFFVDRKIASQICRQELTELIQRSHVTERSEDSPT